MTKRLAVRLLPSLIPVNELADKCVVMTDVLRASTTIIHAIANGARAIYPVAAIDDSIELAKQLGSETLIGGERGGKIVPGFNCGNSPREYLSEVVADRELVLCTSNGTYTLDFCRRAGRILIGAFVNLSAICDELSKHDDCLVACAGTDRKLTGEDTLFAGALVERLADGNKDLQLDDGAFIARAYWQTTCQNLETHQRRLWEVLSSECRGGRNLMKLGYQADIEFCAQIDSVPIVPELNLKTWKISKTMDT